MARGAAQRHVRVTAFRTTIRIPQNPSPAVFQRVEMGLLASAREPIRTNEWAKAFGAVAKTTENSEKSTRSV
jgi:hypothetical protein